MELKSVEDTSWLQLFIKNTALCKHESGRIRCDACPVPGTLIDGVSASEAPDRSPANGGRNYNGPKVAKFLVGKFRPARMAQ